MYKAYDIWCCSYMMLTMLNTLKWSMLLYVMMTNYDVSCMKQNITYGLLSCFLDYRGYGALHDLCTCRLGMGLLVSVLYVILIWTIEHENVNITLWWYFFGYYRALFCCDLYLCSLDCAWKAFKWLSMISKEMVLFHSCL